MMIPLDWVLSRLTVVWQDSGLDIGLKIWSVQELVTLDPLQGMQQIGLSLMSSCRTVHSQIIFNFGWVRNP